MRPFVRVVKKIAIGFAVCLVLLGGLFALAQTESGKRQVASWLGRLLSPGPHLQVRLGELEGTIPFNARFDRIAMSDQKGIWLEAKRVSVTLSSGALFRGRLRITELGADEIALNRLPPSQERKKEARPSSWFHRLPAFVPRAFTIDRLIIGPAVVGEEVTVSLKSRLSADQASNFTGFFEIKTIDGPAFSAMISWALKGEEPELLVDAKIEEDTGIFSRFLGFEEIAPLSVDMSGEGPIRDWQGKLSVRLGKAASLEAAIRLAEQDGLRLNAEGNFRFPPSLLPDTLRPLVTMPQGPFLVDLEYRHKRELVVHRATIETQEAALGVTGQIDFKKGRLQGDWTLELHDLGSLGSAIGRPIAGRLMARGSFLGPIEQPEAAVSLTIQNPQLAGFHAGRLENEFRLKPRGPLGPSFRGLDLTWNGSVEGLLPPAGITLPEERFSWTVVAQIPTQETIIIEDLRLTSENITATASGQIHPLSRSYQGNVEIGVRDLGPLSNMIGRPISGKMLLHTLLQYESESRSLRARFDGRLHGLGPLPAFLGRLSTPQLTYAGEIQLEGMSDLTISQLKIHSDALAFDGTGSINLLTKEVSGEYRVEIPSLAVFSDAVGWPLDGSANIDGEIKGSLLLPQFFVRAKADHVAVRHVPFRDISVDLHIEEFKSKPQGHLEIAAQYQGFPFKAITDIAIGPQQLELTNLIVETHQTQITGSLAFSPDNRTVRGSLLGKSTDLSVFSGPLAQEITGRAEFQARLSQEGRGQSIDLRLHGEEIGSPYGTVRKLNLLVRLSDAFKTPMGAGEVTITDFHRGGLLVEALEVKGEGDFQRISLAALARGRYRETFEMKTQGSLTTTGQDKHLEIRSLEGRYGECPIKLAEQTTISRLSDGYVLKTLALSLGTGRLFASGRVDTASVSFAARLEALSLGPLHLIGSPGLDGKISGKIRVEGPPDRPEVTVALRSVGIRLLEPAFRDLPPADVSLEADLKDGVLEASVAVKGMTQRVIEGELQCPVEFTLLPLSLSVPREGNLQGRILATGDLSRVMSFFPAAYQTFGGLVSVDLTLSGKIEAPELSGSVQVEDGVYENARTGTILRKIEIHAAASGQRLTISQARATDGDGGVITADGWIDIVPTQRFPLLIHVHLKKATLVRQDWATAQMDGQLGLWGSLADLALKGGLTVEPADIRIPERATAHIQELEVIEVNKPGETAPTAGVEKPENSGSVLLDLTLDFPQRIFIRGRGLESEWEGKLQLTGTVREPAVRGTLSVVRGRFNLFGKNLTLIRGLISFDGSIPPTPILDVVAEGRRNDLTASIAFSGPPSDLQVTIESDPPLPSDEVLSHLLFGRGLADLSPLQGMKIASAVSTLTGTGGGALDIMDRTRRLVGLDDLDVKEPTGETGEVAIGAGKYLNDDIYVEVEQGIGSTRGKLSVEYELTPNITVETEAGTDAQGGIGFNWRFDY